MQSDLSLPLPRVEIVPEILAPSFDWRGAVNIVVFAAMHLAGFAAFWTGVSPAAVFLCLASYYVRMFGITAGYHRYFSHKTYKMGRLMQFAMAWLACSSAQKGPLWWAAHHRVHHQLSDKPGDIHSPVRESFWWSHLGWILSRKHDATDLRLVPDLAKYPELQFLNKYFLLPPMAWAVACFVVGGWQGLIWGFFISTSILWHCTFMVNSAAHLVGRRRFPTTDDSRNSGWLAILTMGEGWHNNHHFYPSSANQGFYWWELDMTLYLLKGLEKLGLVRGVRRPPARVLALGRLADGEIRTPAAGAVPEKSGAAKPPEAARRLTA